MAEAPERPPVEDWKTDFDYMDPRFTQDPYPILEELRAECPIAHSDRYGGLTLLSRQADVAAAAHDTAAFSSRRLVPNEIPIDRHGLVLPPINLDPPDHTASRRTMLPFFSPRAIEAWEPTIREICQGLLDRLKDRAEFDAALEYAQEIPGDITARMMGVPLADTPQFRTWIHDLLEVGPNDPEVARATSDDMMRYMQGLIDTRRRDGYGEDVVSYLMQHDVDGERLTDDEIARMLFLIMIAGIDTTWSAIGFSLLHLATNPEDRRRLVAEPDLVPSAVEEFLRAYSPVFVARVTGADAEVNGCPVDAGQWTMLSYPSANRDPEAFERADEVLIDRQENRHAAFGLGVHRCLGSNLARLEMCIAIEMFMEQFPDFELTDPDAVRYSAGLVRGPRVIPVRVR